MSGKKLKLLDKKQLIRGNFLIEIPYTEGEIELISAKPLKDKLIIYVYKGKSPIEFSPGDVKFFQLSNVDLEEVKAKNTYADYLK